MNKNEEIMDTYVNASGCADPTAYAAIQKADADYVRFHKVLRMIFAICNLAGFWVEGRIVLRDMNTGKLWK